MPVMHEEAEAAGIHSVYDGPWEFFVGGGGAALDCDGSGFPSVFLAGGKNPARLFVNRSKAGGPLKFEEKPLDIGADPKMLENVIGAYPIDIDGDGHMDLFVLRVGGNLLLKGGPDCTFTLANKEWGFDGDPGWTTSFAAEWEPGQKFPTLAIGHYVDRGAPGSPWGTCEENSLFRPQPATSPTIRSGPRSRRAFARCRCCSPTGTSRACRRCASPTTGNITAAARSSSGASSLARRRVSIPAPTGGGMCRSSAWGSPRATSTGPAIPQYFLTSMGDEKLQKLDPEAGRGELPIYRDIASEVGATAHIPYTGGDKRPSTAWHAEFADFNNDGLLDIFVSKGNLEQMPDFAAYDPSNLLLGQWSGKFAEAGESAGIACFTKGRGALIADFNLDGRARHPADQQGLERLLVPQSRRQGRESGEIRRSRWATGPKSGSSSPTPTATPSAPGFRSRRARGRRRAFVQSRRRRRLGPFGLHPCRPRHGRAGRNPRAMAGRRLEPLLSRVRQPVRCHRPHEAAGRLLVSGSLDVGPIRPLPGGSAITAPRLRLLPPATPRGRRRSA